MQYTFDMPLVFLDFDGVVSRGNSGDFARLPLLSQWLLDHPTVAVVVSSSWRHYHSVPELVDILYDPAFGESVVGNRIVGVTKNLPGLEEGFKRELLVNQWRADHGHQGRFACLDDATALFSPGWPNLVATNGDKGLMVDDLQRLSELLGL